MQHYAVVFFPKIDLEKLQAFREKYDPKWNVLNPHLTLVFPFVDIPEDGIVSHLTEVAQQVVSFPITLSGFTKSFDDYLFLLVSNGREHIFNLHDKLYTGILSSQLRTDIPFIPHMTLGFFKTNENQFNKDLYKKALSEAEDLMVSIDTEFNEFSLIQGDGVMPARIIETFKLHSS
ncbi:MAG TPA: 2'-5' RNA ligase family protein [Candidatus Eisenbacteria bacterium]|nr:2'-5' RNA ligase family protein [Candidatus Eisenbacteria bacterium]